LLSAKAHTPSIVSYLPPSSHSLRVNVNVIGSIFPKRKPGHCPSRYSPHELPAREKKKRNINHAARVDERDR
jgi:hypothetical protein